MHPVTAVPLSEALAATELCDLRIVMPCDSVERIHDQLRNVVDVGLARVGLGLDALRPAARQLSLANDVNLHRHFLRSDGRRSLGEPPLARPHILDRDVGHVLASPCRCVVDAIARASALLASYEIDVEAEIHGATSIRLMALVALEKDDCLPMQTLL